MNKVEQKRFDNIANHIANGIRGTFTGVTYRRVGVERGKGDAKVRYGDALVSEVLVTGFDYKNLVTRSIRVATADPAGFFATVANNLCAKFPSVASCIDSQSVLACIDEQVQSWKDHQITPKDEPHYEPLIIDGSPVIGAKVYKGDGAGVKDSIYLAGLRISSKVLEQPVNGYWITNSKPETIVKELVRELAPVGRYVTLRLSPDNLVDLRVGGTAARYAEKIGMEIHDAVVEYLEDL